MYYWNTKALAHELAEDTLSKQYHKNYYLAAALVVSAVYYYGMYSPYYDVRVIGVEAVLTLVIMLIGIQRTYQANGGDQGIHFLNRIKASYFPILMQNTVLGVVLLASYQYFGLVQTAFEMWYEWCVLAFTIFLQILFSLVWCLI